MPCGGITIGKKTYNTSTALLQFLRSIFNRLGLSGAQHNFENYEKMEKVLHGNQLQWKMMQKAGNLYLKCLI